MFAKLIWTATVNQTSAFNDLIAVLTGETDVNNLSSNLNKTSSFITAAWAPAGWTMHDNISAAVKVLKAPIVDEPTAYKYVKFTNNGSNNGITMQQFETWNEVTHVGTNGAYFNNLGLIFAELNLTYSSPLYLSASARHIYSAPYKQNTLFAGAVGVFEHTRINPWQAIGSSYIPACSLNGNAQQARWDGPQTSPYYTELPFMIPRMLGTTGVDITGSSAYAGFLTPFGLGAFQPNGGSADVPLQPVIGTTTINTQYRNASKETAHNLIPFGVCNPTTTWVGQISVLSEVYFTTYGYGSVGDTLTVGGNDYVALPTQIGTTGLQLNGYTFACRLG